MTSDSSSAWCASPSNEPLVHLGDWEAEAFRGGLTPKAEVGQKRHGVNAVFLENSESYYKQYQGFDYWRMLLVQALSRIKVDNAKIIAADINPNLLSILRGLFVSRSLKQRCVAVAMDARKPYIKEGSVDLISGAAILHHLIEPGEFIGSTLRVLKSGGWHD